MSDAADLVVRLSKEETYKLSPAIVNLLSNKSEYGLLCLLSDPVYYLARLDTDGIDLLLHSIVKKIDTVHNWRVVDRIFDLPPLYRTLQDSDKNSVLHYLAQKGVDIFRHGSVEDFVYRNKFGNTPLHWLAKYPEFHERIAVLPYRVTSVHNGMGMTALDVIEKIRADAEAEEMRKEVVASTEVLAGLPLNYKLPINDSALSSFRVGFEFEFVSGLSHTHIAELLHLSGKRVGTVTDDYGIPAQAKYDSWHVTGDPSIAAKEGDHDIEIISPPMEFSEVRSSLKLIWKMLSDINAYTNESCGLHITLSHDGNGFSSPTFNPIKLALFLGDDDVLRAMDREDNYNCRAFLAYVRGIVHADLKSGFQHILGPHGNPDKPARRLDYNNLSPVPTDYDAVTLVDKIATDPTLRLRLVNSFDRNISLNLTKVQTSSGATPLLEYRALGNGWSYKKPEMFENIARRLAATSLLAMDPTAALDTYKILIARDIIQG
jgi:hypothetical protein